uniref:Uncharacterized protein n=1 Tax=Odontella aurita TaxID=265563 RepID=A0A7S4MDG7_9STRA|mmetsp:Transcript_18520/g.53397  ORF Transcript_18520/g.53397 Transcript_18520/m.53397 type:complete len:908 (+) Transcript_18520:205-2928(+)
MVVRSIAVKKRRVLCMMHPPQYCAHVVSAKSSQGGQSKVGRSKLSLRKKRGKKKKEAKAAVTNTNSCCQSQSSYKQSSCKVVHGQCDEAKENNSEHLLLTLSNSKANVNSGIAAGRDLSSSYGSREGEQLGCSGKNTCNDEASVGKGSKRGISNEVVTVSHKRKKVPIPSFSAFSSPLDEEKSSHQAGATRIESNQSTSGSRAAIKHDVSEERTKSDSCSPSGENVRSKYFVAKALGGGAAKSAANNKADTNINGLGVDVDSDNDSDLPSPVFARRLNQPVEQAGMDNEKKENSTNKNCISLLCRQSRIDGLYVSDKQVWNDIGSSLGAARSTKNRASEDQEGKVDAVKEKAPVCVIEIDESDSDIVNECEITKSLETGLFGRKEDSAHLNVKTIKSPDEEDLFDVPIAKKIADRERELDTRHSDLLRQLSKKCSSQSKERTRGQIDKRGGSRAKISKKKVCALCSTCSCSRGAALKGLENGATEEVTDPFRGLARSDADVEKALISRLKRLEKSSAWFDHLSHKVGRELKKHRSKMISKSVRQYSATGQTRPRFLQDVDSDSPEVELSSRSHFSNAQVRKAQRKFLGYCKDFQPTLTQLIQIKHKETPKSRLDSTMEGEKHESKSNLDSSSAKVPFNDVPVSDASSHCVKDDFPNIDDKCSEEDQHCGAEECAGEMANNAPGQFLNQFPNGSDRPLANNTGLWKTSAGADVNDIEDEVGQSAPRRRKDEQEGNDSSQKNADCVENDENGFPCAKHQDGFEHLLHLFHSPVEPVISPTKSHVLCSSIMHSQCLGEDEKGALGMSPTLSQKGETAFTRITENVMNSPAKLASIVRLCPQWKDNVQYSLIQDDAGVIREALGNVKSSRLKLAEARKRILESLQEQDSVLELYELSLQESLLRFDVDGGV